MNFSSIPLDISFDNIIQNDNKNKFNNLNEEENDNKNSFKHTQQKLINQRVDNIEKFQNFMTQNSLNNQNIPAEVNSENKMDIIQAKNDYDSFIIKAPPSREIFRDKIVKLFVDSRDRNTIQYPTSSKFKVELQQEYRTIKSIELVISQVPGSQYVVNQNNNILDFIIGNQDINNDTETENIKIRTGNYDKTIFVVEYSLSIKKENPYIIKQDNLAKQIEKQLKQKINNISNSVCNPINPNQQTKPNIRIEYDDIKENYIFNTDLCPINNPNKTYQGELLQLLFKGNIKPYGSQEIEKVPKRDIFQTVERDEEGNIIYEEVKVGDNTKKYKKNSIGPIIGFGIDNYNGYIVNNITNTTTNDLTLFTVQSVNITNENFTDDLIENQYILIKQNNKLQRFKIKEIIDGNTFKVYDTSDISLVGDNSPLIPPPFSNTIPILSFDDAELYSGRIIGPFCRDFEKDKYVILKIKMCHTIDGHESSVQNSFAIIPFSNNFAFDIKPNDFSKALFERNFNPPIPRLNELEFEFLNYDGSRYDFNGKEVNLLFFIKTLNQPGKYGN